MKASKAYLTNVVCYSDTHGDSSLNIWNAVSPESRVLWQIAYCISVKSSLWIIFSFLNNIFWWEDKYMLISGYLETLGKYKKKYMIKHSIRNQQP